MEYIKEIKHANPENTKTSIINWCLGNTCNYNCSYCPENLHSGSITWINLPLALKFCEKLILHYSHFDQNIEFLFTGGEPTLYPGFPKLLKRLKELGCKVGVITNGSRTLTWWSKNCHLFDKIILTYHAEFANKSHVFDLVHLLSDERDVHVNFTMLPSMFETILDISHQLNYQFPTVSITLKPLLIDFGDIMYDYSLYHRNVIKTLKFKTSKRFASTRGLMKKILTNDIEISLKASDFILNDENHWEGWKCKAGVELIYIDYKGDVYRGTCKQGGKITNIFLNEEFTFPTSEIICRKKTCHCITDIMTSKVKV